MAPWSLKGVGFLPVILGLVISGGCIIVYIIAVANKDVSPYVPFISEAGAKPPEAGIFSIFLYLSSTVGLPFTILRFMIISEYNQSVDQCLSRVNVITLVMGIGAMLGMVIVAAYPMSSVFVAHIVGATTIFIPGAIFMSCQTWMTYRMNPYYNGLAICRIRLALTIIAGVTTLVMCIFSPIASYVWKAASHDHWSGKKQPEDKGFDAMVLSATAEWVMALLFVFYFFTFIREFQRITLHVNIQITPNEMEEQQQNGNAPRPTMRSTLL